MMKSVEIYFRDLTHEAQAKITEAFSTSEKEENWDVAPLTIIDRETEEEEPVEKVKRVEDWKEFSRHIQSYIREQTAGKYSMAKGSDFDLMSISDSKICIWNILKYALRNLNGKGKEHDLEKIVHYAQMAWTLSGRKAIGDEKVPA